MAGSFGLIGAGGALMASITGRIADKIDTRHIVTASTAMIILSYIMFGFYSTSLAGLIIGVILLDLGLQASHIANQTKVFSLDPEARNRLNTVYMFTYFIGGATGTFLASQAWQEWKWDGVVAVGLIFSSLSLLIHLAYFWIKEKKGKDQPN